VIVRNYLRCGCHRCYEGHKELVHEVYRTSRTYGGAERPTLSIDPIIRSTSVHSTVLRICLHHLVGGKGEETLSSGEEACGKRRFRRLSSQLIGFWHVHLLHVGAPWMGAILQRCVGKYPHGICLGIFMTLHSREGRLVGGRTPCAGKEE
jgi:hypothetical protein